MKGRNDAEGYQQIYILKHASDGIPFHVRDVFFRCGNWCYDGMLPFEFLKDPRGMTLEHIPLLAPTLQKQQDDLSFSCPANVSIADSNSFAPAINLVSEAQDFLLSQLSSSSILSILESSNKEWVYKETDHYFELVADIPSSANDIQCICSKKYSKGICLVLIYFEGIFYAIVQNADDEQPLLDVRFPDISHEGDGITLSIYDVKDENRDDKRILWRKLSLWQTLSSSPDITTDKYYNSVDLQSEILRTANLSTAMYQQSYCIQKSSPKPDCLEHDEREVLFRFGSWCYSGRIELVSDLSLHDISHVIPALRVQQKKLGFLCDISKMPSDIVYTEPLLYMEKANQAMLEELSNLDNMLPHFMDRLESLGYKPSDKDWVLGDSKELFFEFGVNQSDVFAIMTRNNIELIANKCYHPNGVVFISIYFGGTIFVSISDCDGDQPLLDSKFPCVVPGRGYRLKSYPFGLPHWPDLRKLSIWQSIEAIRDDNVNTPITNDEGVLILCDDDINEQDCTTKDNKVDDTVLENSKSNFSQMEYKEGKEIEQNEVGHNEGKQPPLDIAEGKNIDDMPRDEKKVSDYINSPSDKNDLNPDKPKLKEIQPEKIHKNSYTDEGKSMNKDNKGRSKQGDKLNLGAFHHLAPLKKSSRLKEKVDIVSSCPDSKPCWDQRGRPLEQSVFLND